MDFSNFVSAQDVADIVGAILAIGGALVLPRVIMRGVDFVLSMIGPDPDDPNDPRNYDMDSWW